jgi:hypothetical protein
MLHIEKQIIENQEIVIRNDQVNFWGPELTLDHCRIVIHSSTKNLVITRTKFLNCRIEVRRELINFRWLDTWLQGCSFKGRLRGNDFGHWSPPYQTMGGIEGCDFTEATLDGCRFIGCQIKTISLPSWPCFTILDPRQTQTRFESIKSPVDLSFLSRPYIHPPENAVAYTYYAPSFLKEWKIEETEEDLKAALEPLDFVML